MTQELMPGCSMPLLGAIDAGTAGACVRNLCDGTLEYIKMPQDDSGTDLEAVRSFFDGYDMVLMEHPPLGGFSGHTRVSENGCFQQYKELYGFLCGAKIPFHTVTPKKWQKFLQFPPKKEVGDDVWKSFLWDQSLQRFPKQKIPKYAADAFLLYKVLTMIYHKPTSEWP